MNQHSALKQNLNKLVNRVNDVIHMPPEFPYPPYSGDVDLKTNLQCILIVSQLFRHVMEHMHDTDLDVNKMDDGEIEFVYFK